MAYIKTINPEDATGRVKPLYDGAMKRSGNVANIVRVMGLDPRSAMGSMGFYTALMKSDNALAPSKREMLAAVVSAINGCYY